MGRLAGKTALITGATGGIGEATVHRFLEEGARVMAVGRSAEKLAALAGRVGDNEVLDTFTVDATDERGVEASVKATRERFDGLDVVFANAGTEGAAKPLELLTADEFRLPFETNVLGVWLLMKYAAPVMREQGAGSIIVTASTAGLIGFGGLSSYVASKHGVIGLTKCAALELAEFNVRVNAIAPGPIDNRMIHSLEDQLSPEDPEAMEAMLRELIPMKRYGVNAEVANMALFLASDESSHSTGSVFTLDGGYTAT
ncbi:MAG: SDR family NAD(P)-dependent oxidoreductase [Xanthomonadales bacterium]|jgi:NAD(P)-dependent dehydrogenase (short-subunit alcohol dehydrogenase family)|nr:SDR family NAD(P)-dependent oxidoreductase [Xanthomonadales bacterium]